MAALSDESETDESEWSSMIKRFGFLKPLAIGCQSVEPCSYNIHDSQTNCPCFNRIKYVLNYYDIWCSNQLSIAKNTDKSMHYYINEHLLCYNTTALLNDYNHILKFHHSNDEHFEKMTSELDKCDMIECGKMNRKKQEQKENFLAEKLCIDILDRIHCSLCHSYDLFRLTASQKQKLQQLNAKNEPRILNSSTISLIREISARSTFNLEIVKNRVEDDNKCHDNYHIIKNNKFVHSSPVIHNLHELKQKSIYEFGHTFNYFHIKPHFKNLKEELIHNKIYKISLSQWICTLEKAYLLNKCASAKNMFYKKHFQDLAIATRCENTHDGCLVSDQLWNRIKSSRSCDSASFIPNILSILFCCNFNTLKYHLSQTYRLRDPSDSICCMRSRHEQYANWAMLIHDTVSLCGAEIAEPDEFYRGISGSSFIPKTTVCFYSPTSTSSNILVAQNFAGNEGLVMCIESNLDSNIHQKYIDCSWISDYHYEAERLFAGDRRRIIRRNAKISSIIDCNTGNCFIEHQIIIARFLRSLTHRYLSSATLFECLTEDEIKEYRRAINNYINILVSQESFHSVYFFKKILDSVGVLHINLAIKQFYPHKFFNCDADGTLNMNMIAGIFANVSNIFVYHSYVYADIVSFDPDKFNKKGKYALVFDAELNENVIATKYVQDEYAMVSTKYVNNISFVRDKKFMAINLKTATIKLRYTEYCNGFLDLESVTKYALEFRICNGVSGSKRIFRRYSQFRALWHKLIRAEIMDEESIEFPPKTSGIGVNNQRFDLLDRFMAFAVEKCKQENKFEELYRFLFLLPRIDKMGGFASLKFISSFLD